MPDSNELLFHQIPTRIDIIGPSLAIKQTIFFMGDQPAALTTNIKKDGSRAVEHIFKTAINGGDVDWDDMDDEDFEAIINAEEQLDILSKEETNQANNDKDTFLGETFNRDITVFREDSVSILQKKIAYITGIAPEYQFLSINGRCMTHYLQVASGEYGVYNDWNDLYSMLKNVKTRISEVPIDEEYVMLKFNSSIVDTTKNNIGFFIDQGQSLHIQLIPLANLIPNQKSLQFLLKSDRQSFDSIYSSTIERYFHHLSISGFIAYIASSDDVEMNYHRQYADVFKQRNQTIEMLNKMPHTSLSSKNVSIIINSIVFAYPGLESNGANLMKMFNSINLELIPSAFFADLFITKENKLLQIRKASKYSGFAGNVLDGVSMHFKPYLDQVRHYRNSSKLVITMLPTDDFSKITIAVDAFCAVEIYIEASKKTEDSNDRIIRSISLLVSPIIEYLNTLDNIFLTAYKLLPDIEHYKVLRSNNSLIIPQKCEYNHLVREILTYLDKAELLYARPMMNASLRFRDFGIEPAVPDEAFKGIKIFANANVAQINLIGLSPVEFNFYVDMLIRLINAKKAAIEIKMQNQNIVSVDPVLFKYKSQTKYSRVCQKKMQPVIADPNNKNAFRYHNFTFNTPQYYACENSLIPHLGLLSGYHPNGYCLPCCRKLPQKDRDDLAKKSIKGEPIESDTKSSQKNYVIDYPTDFTPNEKLIGRFIALPKFIISMLTKGENIIISGACVDYSIPNYESLQLISKFLGHKSDRELIIDLIAFVKKNIFKVMQMPAVAFAFIDAKDLISALNNEYLKQSFLTTSAKNWNDIIIDIAICMGINIAVLIDVRAKASDCTHAITKSEECSIGQSSSNNPNIKMSRLEYCSFNKPLLMLLKRLDTEYSIEHNHRRYSYFPIIDSIHQTMRDHLFPMSDNVVNQLKKIFDTTQTNHIMFVNKSFTYDSLATNMPPSVKVKKLFRSSTGKVAYAELASNSNKTMLITLLATDGAMSLSEYKPTVYTMSMDDMIDVLTRYNKKVVPADVSDYLLYVKTYSNLIKDRLIVKLPLTDKYLLKLDKFIVLNKKVIGARLWVCQNAEETISQTSYSHIIEAYCSPCSVASCIDLLKQSSSQVSVILKSPNQALIKKFIEMPVDMIKRKTSIVRDRNAYADYSDYFCETTLDPKLLIGTSAANISYPETIELKQTAYKQHIYGELVKAMIKHWMSTKPLKLISVLEQLISKSSSSELALLSNNLIENWIDKIEEALPGFYPRKILQAEMHELITFIETNGIKKTKEAIIKSFQMESNPVNDIDLHSLQFSSNSRIRSIVMDAAPKCILKVKSLPEKRKKSIIGEWYLDADGKVLVLDKLYDSLLNQFIEDLSNPFRREYILSSALTQEFMNSIKVVPHINELIYIQSL